MSCIEGICPATVCDYTATPFQCTDCTGTTFESWSKALCKHVLGEKSDAVSKTLKGFTKQDCVNGVPEINRMVWDIPTIQSAIETRFTNAGLDAKDFPASINALLRQTIDDHTTFDATAQSALTGAINDVLRDNVVRVRKYY